MSREYAEKAKKRITIEAAASAWARGVPWTEAINIAEHAMSRASPKPLKALPKAKPQARAKVRAKARAGR